MKSNDAAGAEVIGALILFGIFVATIAFMNVTAVPNAGLANEEDHYERTLSTLNGLQSEAETAAIPGNVGSSVARSLDLAPARHVGQDFFSFFLASPARASGELAFEPDYGNLSLLHYKNGNPNAFYDIGGATTRFPLGKLTFDPHPVFRSQGVIRLENGGIVSTTADASSMRFEPAITVGQEGGTTVVNVQARVLNGSAYSIGGIAPVRVGLVTEAATLTSPATDNAQNMTLQMSTSYGAAWVEYLDRVCSRAGLTLGAQYFVGLEAGTGGALDRVTWYVNGTGTGNDMRLTTGLAVYKVTVS